jgi:surfactin synthase thioesterase subunit
MGSAVITETNSLMKWMSGRGLGPFGLAGYSMGGLMACLAGTLSRKPLALAPLLAPHSAAPIFTEGVFKTNVEWKILNSEMKMLQEEGLARDDEDASSFLLRVLSSTDLRRFPQPAAPVALAPQWAEHDLFIRGSSEVMARHWGPHIQVQPPLKGGHVTAFISQTYEKTFSLTVCKAFGSLLRYYPAWECSRDWGGLFPVVIDPETKI